MTNLKNEKKGFTLLEILLVVGIISILAGIVILAINPTKQLGDTRDAQRRSDVLTILNVIYQYSIDNDGDLEGIADGSDLTTADTCTDEGTDAYDLEDALAGTTETYLVSIPVDPTEGVVDTTSAYYVTYSDTTGRITVCAPNAENNTISVTR